MQVVESKEVTVEKIEDFKGISIFNDGSYAPLLAKGTIPNEDYLPSPAYSLFNLGRHLVSAEHYRLLR